MSEFLVPNSNDIVKYKEKDGTEIKWLPIFGKGSYLDFMCKLVPNHKLNDPIIMKIAKEFNSKLNNFTETNLNGEIFILDDNLNLCDKCNSKELQYIRECILTSPEVNWLKISCEF